MNNNAEEQFYTILESLSELIAHKIQPEYYEGSITIELAKYSWMSATTLLLKTHNKKCTRLMQDEQLDKDKKKDFK